MILRRHTLRALVTLLIVLSGLMMPSSVGRAATLSFAHPVGGTSPDQGASVVVDTAGNVYQTGFFHGTVDFDPGPGTFSVASNANSDDVYLKKVDAGGNLVWARTFGGTGIDQGRGVAVDTAGNVYVTGIFRLTVDFDPGADTFELTSAGGGDGFVVKLDAAGTLVWARHVGGTGTETAIAVAVAGDNDVYLTGVFTNTADFDPGADVAELTSAGGNDGFVLKLDASGNFDWVRQIGGAAADEARAIALDGAGHVLVVGYYSGAVDFDTGSGTASLTSAGDLDAFAAGFDADGDLAWVKGFGSSGIDQVIAVAVDTAGNVCLAGVFSDTVDFNPGTGTFELTSDGDADAFVVKLDSNGNFIWARRFGSTDDDAAASVALDVSRNVYVGGFFAGTVDFDPGAGTFPVVGTGPRDSFAAKLDSSGNFVWAGAFTGPAANQANGLAVDASGQSYLSGTFSSTVDFDPGSGTVNRTSAGQTDAYLVKLTQTAPPVHTVPGPQATPEDAPLTFSPGGGNEISIVDADAGSSPLRVSLGATNGTVTLSTLTGLTFTQGDGTADSSVVFGGTLTAINAALNGLVFTPSPNLSGAASLQITTLDQVGPTGGQSDGDAVAIAIGEAADPPTISAIADVAVNEDTPTSAIPFTVGDAETAPASLVVTATSDNTTLVPNAAIQLGGSGAARTVRVTPAANLFGTALIDVEVSDGTSTTHETFTLTVNAVNDAPVAVNDSYSTGAMQPLTVPVGTGLLANDTDVESTPLQAQALTNPAHGSVTLNPNGSFTYTPARSFAGTDTFTYRASDATLTSSPATVTITVTPSTCAPRASVKVTTSAVGGKLQATVEALPLDGQTNNRLIELQFGEMKYGTVTINGQPVASDTTYPVAPNTTRVIFLVERTEPGKTTTIHFTAVDACGPWPSLVGGGPNAF